jgi:hypothetical protein
MTISEEYFFKNNFLMVNYKCLKVCLFRLLLFRRDVNTMTILVLDIFVISVSLIRETDQNIKCQRATQSKDLKERHIK